MKRTVFVAVVLAAAVFLTGTAVRRVFFDDAVSVTGYLQPVSTTQLNFPSDGTVTEIYVAVGDVVEAGQVLAKQDTSALEAELAIHEAALSATENPPPADPADAAARAQLSAAQARAAQAAQVDDAAVARAASNLETARATLAASQQQASERVDECGIPPTSTTTTVTAAPADGINPPITLPPESPARLNSCTQLVRQVTQDEADLSRAVAAYNEAVSRRHANAMSHSASVIAAARGVEAANSRVAVSGSSTAAAVAAHAAAIAKTRAAIDAAVLVAPTRGIVGSIGGVPGEIAGPEGVRIFSTPQPLPQKESSGIQLFPQAAQQATPPMSQFRSFLTIGSEAVKVVAQVGESDLRKVTDKRTATITFPAIPRHSYTGVVSNVEPQAVNIDGKVSFLVELTLTEQPAFEEVVRTRAGETPRPVFGLTANVRF